MFAPDEVFSKKTSKLPRGHYFPSPYNKQYNEIDNVTCNSNGSDENEISDSKLSANSISDCFPKNDISETQHFVKEPGIKAHMNQLEDQFISLESSDKENASTSVDDLIRDIDKKLAVDPNFNPPEATSKADINNILSVSENSNDISNNSVISPNALNFYLSRFKNNEPTHPSKRSNHGEQKSTNKNLISVNSCGHLVTEKDCDDITCKSSVSFDSSSFLNNVLSSDDSISWEFPEDISVYGNEIKTNKLSQSPYASESMKHHMNRLSVPKNKPSYIEEVTGKTFAELSELVPDEILNPKSENDDILYQWRLKKRIAEAKNQTTDLDLEWVSAKDSESASLKKYENGPISHEYKADKKSCNVSKEIQTDAEKTESACQVNIELNSKKPNDENSQKSVNKGFLNVIYNQNQDSCSDFSISSISTDDLTNISFLDDDDDDDDNNVEKSLPIGENTDQEKNSIHNKTLDSIEVNNKSHESVNENDNTIQNEPPAHDLEYKTIQSFSKDESKSCLYSLENLPSALNCESANQEKTEELISYLDNIKESLQDELLDIFIEKYKSVLCQVKAIENEINKRCNEH